jgi:(p)ppGpp synthase/HD superfamily hydrolase
MTDKELIEKAKVFALQVHARDRWNDTERASRLPHFEEVARLVTESGGSAVEIAAAWLHDSVEDTPTTIEQVKQEFGKEVARVVEGLTDTPGWEKLPIVERKAKQAEHIKNESLSVRRVKLADQCSNVKAVGEKVFPGMEGETAVAYCTGAKNLADICASASLYLDQIFQERYKTTLKNLASRA